MFTTSDVIAHVFCFLSENIALHKNATQSVSLNKYTTPELALNGDTSPQGECAWATVRLEDIVLEKPLPSAWWSVDLASPDPSQRFVITSVTIYFKYTIGMYFIIRNTGEAV